MSTRDGDSQWPVFVSFVHWLMGKRSVWTDTEHDFSEGAD